MYFIRKCVYYPYNKVTKYKNNISVHNVEHNGDREIIIRNYVNCKWVCQRIMDYFLLFACESHYRWTQFNCGDRHI